MKTWLKIVLPLAVLALGGGGATLLIHFAREVQPQMPKPLPPRIETVEARKEDHQFRIITQGTVEPRTRIDLVIEVTGRVVEVSPSLESGGFFREGDTLLRMDARDFELALIQTQAQVEDARFRLQLEEAEAEVARREWERLGKGEANDLLLRKPQLAQARAALAAAEARLEAARRDLDRCTLQAPFAGRIGEKRVDIGQYITKGTPVARIYSVDYADVRLPLEAGQLAYVDLPMGFRGESPPDHHAKVLLRASLGGRTHQWDGVIDRVEGEIDTRTRMIFVVARVADPYGRTGHPDRPPLASGLFVEAEILGRRLERVFLLPRTALRGSDTVLVVEEGDRLRTRSVEVARIARREMIVTAGLEDGERVCTSTLDVYTEGMRVRTGEEPSSSEPSAAPGQEGRP